MFSIRRKYGLIEKLAVKVSKSSQPTGRSQHKATAITTTGLKPPQTPEQLASARAKAAKAEASLKDTQDKAQHMAKIRAGKEQEMAHRQTQGRTDSDRRQQLSDAMTKQRSEFTAAQHKSKMRDMAYATGEKDFDRSQALQNKITDRESELTTLRHRMGQFSPKVQSVATSNIAPPAPPGVTPEVTESVQNRMAAAEPPPMPSAPEPAPEQTAAPSAAATPNYTITG